MRLAVALIIVAFCRALVVPNNKCLSVNIAIYTKLHFNKPVVTTQTWIKTIELTWCHVADEIKHADISYSFWMKSHVWENVKTSLFHDN